MRRALLCCALLAVSVVGCSSSSATFGPQPYPGYNSATNAPYPAASMAGPWVAATPAPTTAGQQPWPVPTANPWSTPYPWETQYPWETPRPTVVPTPRASTNPYTDTNADHLSTFGLDVDTASYSIARKAIAQGIRPDPSVIRPEEWVNYFDQGYAAPESGAFAIHADGGPTPFLRANEVLLRVGVKARESSTAQRPGAALTFVVDVSGSMGDEGKLELVKQSLVILVNQLRGDDTVAIVAFTTNAFVVLPPTSAESKDTIERAIGTLHSMDSTNVDAGLTLGYELARAQYRQDGINRVVLATDGVANTGNVDPQEILAKVGDASTAHIQLVAIGVGMGTYNDSLLETLADKGEGFYAYVDNLDEARRVFVDRLTTTIDTVAIDAKAQIDFNPATVAGYRLIGYEDRGVPDNQFRNPDQKGGGIGAGHQVTALYALILRPTQSHDGLLATVTLRWTDPKTSQSTELSKDVMRSNLATDFGRTDPHFKLDSLVAATAEQLRHSPWIPNYSMRDLQAAASMLQWQLPTDERTRDFLGLISQIRTWD
jgi:Ca-activated chloride channel family protein